MTTSKGGPVSVSRRIDAPVARVFAVIADPNRHPEFDGSAMLRETPAQPVVSGVGDVFTMKMRNPEMGDYEMDNVVVEFEPDRRMSWEPRLSAASRPEDSDEVGVTAGHIWGFALVPDGPDATVATESYDCSRAPEWLRRAVDDGNRWVECMTTSLERLDRLCTGDRSEPLGAA
jgi:uncharacterized protein YndB with AHSA1/START domain